MGMKTTTPPHTPVTTKATDRPTGGQSEPETAAEKNLVNQIFQAGNGQGLIDFCRQLSQILIRAYIAETDLDSLRTRVCASLVTTLQCSHQQAVCLVELALELIHSRVHGEYRRSTVELSYLITMASGAIRDVSAN